ncbi:hypothetical protein SMICM304S_11506 [Streptomyces microflavus]
MDPKAKVCVIRKITDEIVNEPYDYIVLAAGSVTRTFDIPGLLDHARGMKTLAEAAYVRDHVIAQLDLADASHDEAERASRLQFVVVGGGYAGTETAACLQRLTTSAVKHYPRLDPKLIKWHLIDIAPKLMPELGDKLGRAALEVLRKRNIEVSLGVSIAKAAAEEVTFTDGRVLPCRTLIWTAGVAASPLIATLGAETVRGRLAVTPQLKLPGADGVFSLGDAAAVPDLAKGDGAVCPPTAQHAMRQGKVLADNLIASLRRQPLKDYVHKDLGLVVPTSAARTPCPSRWASNACTGCPRRPWRAATTGRRSGRTWPSTTGHDELACSTRSPVTTSYGPGSSPQAGRRYGTSGHGRL